MKKIFYFAIAIVSFSCSKNESSPTSNNERSISSVKLVLAGNSDTITYKYVKAELYNGGVLGVSNGIKYTGYLNAVDTAKSLPSTVRFYVSTMNALESFIFLEAATKESNIIWGANGFLLRPNDFYDNNGLAVKSNMEEVEASIKYSGQNNELNGIDINIRKPNIASGVEYASLQLK